MEIERRGPDSEPKWGILKYLSAEFFHRKSEINQVKLRMNVESNGTCQWHLRSKIEGMTNMLNICSSVHDPNQSNIHKDSDWTSQRAKEF